MINPRFPRADGSSPRVRGTAAPSGLECTAVRFIPACAGNRPSLSAIRRLRSVHPRVCGEQRVLIGSADLSVGSSPRVRGTGIAHSRHCAQDRFIPACAGNSFPDGAVGTFIPVHPRVCGEQVGAAPECFSAAGSSPRVRGTVRILYLGCSRIRFIPACAGNSGATGYSADQSAVHPRVCGEQMTLLKPTPKPYGSSPRVRGTGPGFQWSAC